MSATVVKRGQTVRLNIPAARPIRTLNGVLHEGGQVYRVLGGFGTLVRLSRVSDHAKLIINPEALIPA
jgi:hypothetical protein